MTRHLGWTSILLLAVAGGPSARAERGDAAGAREPLWTELRRSERAEAIAGLPSLTRLAATVGPAVVNVLAVQHEATGAPPFGRAPTRGQGTGFVIHRAGYVVTNHHVIEGADEIRVRLADERELPARLVGSDERTDIALLKVDGAGDLPVAPLGDSDRIEIGEWVVAIGNPFGLDHTVTVGIVSGKERRDVRPGGVGGSGFYDFIQTDASINVGNSGGPLLDLRGEVIGMNTAINASAHGIAFAIPINMVKAIVPRLRERGHAARSWLGALTQPVTPALARAFGLAEPLGALVAEVLPRSPAEACGLAPGDVVVALDGRPVRRSDDLQWQVAIAEAGRRVVLGVRRGSERLELATTLQQDPDEPPPPPRDPPAALHRSPLGIAVSEVTPPMARELGLAEA